MKREAFSFLSTPWCTRVFSVGLLTLCLLYPATTIAQPTVDWVKAFISNDYNAGVDIAIDINDDILVAGIYRDEIAFEGNPNYRFANQGKNDIVLTKIAATGDVLWMKTIAGVGDDRAYRIATDAQGHFYLTGSFERVLRFEENDETHTLESTGKENAFLAKFDTDGNILWSVQAGGDRSDRGIGLAIDADGNVFTSGYFEGEAIFGTENPIHLKSNGQLDAYLAKYNTSGALVWARALGAEKRDIASGITVDAAGRVFITGVTRGPTPILDIDSNLIHGGPTGQDDLFIARYSSSGELEKLIYAGGRGFDAGNAITADEAGNIYVTGYFENQAAFVDLTGQRRILDGQSFDLFVSKFDAMGKMAWTQTAGGEHWDNAYDIDVDENGEVFITGLFRKEADFTGNSEVDIEGIGEANAFIARYTGNGDLAGVQPVKGAKSEGAGIAISKKGDVFLTGLFLQEATFGENQKSVTSTAFNSFVAKYASNGFNEEDPEDTLQRLSEDAPLFATAQNYPNPFTSSTSFEVELQESSFIRLVIHDALGRVIDEIVNQEMGSGIYQFLYDAGNLARGTYFYTLETPESSITRSMTYIE